ncbi:MAG: helix-turn-helix domain-containing protein [Candidatus Pacebacteria bacterium]|nr:helix-turn-helix domain-containing protein [Candidatus Paceibacterota bacterium]
MSKDEEKFEVRDLRKKEKFFVDDLYLNGYAKKCGIYGTGVYLSLCRHANKEQLCYPSLKRISEELKISRSQVIRAIKILKENKIIRVVRVGKKLNNRYFLLDKNEWSGRNFTGIPQELQPVADRNFHSKDTQFKDTNKKEFDFKDLIKNYKNGERRYKPYYWGKPMIWDKLKQKWFVIIDNEWLNFNDKESEIQWKI